MKSASCMSVSEASGCGSKSSLSKSKGRGQLAMARGRPRPLFLPAGLNDFATPVSDWSGSEKAVAMPMRASWS